MGSVFKKKPVFVVLQIGVKTEILILPDRRFRGLPLGLRYPRYFIFGVAVRLRIREPMTHACGERRKGARPNTG